MTVAPDAEFEELAARCLPLGHGAELVFRRLLKPQHGASRCSLGPCAERLQSHPVAELVSGIGGVERAGNRKVRSGVTAHARYGRTSSRLEVKRRPRAQWRQSRDAWHAGKGRVARRGRDAAFLAGELADEEGTVVAPATPRHRSGPAYSGAQLRGTEACPARTDHGDLHRRYQQLEERTPNPERRLGARLSSGLTSLAARL